MRKLPNVDSPRVKRIAGTCATLCAVALAWWLASYHFALPPDVLPQPMQFIRACAQGWFGGTLWPHIGTTLAESLTGFAVGCSVGLALAIFITEFPFLKRSVYPLLMGLQSVPLVALAPLIVAVLGFGLASKVVISALFAFFPMLVNLVAALSNSNPDLLGLYRAFGASRTRTLMDVKLPGAAAAAFAAMQIAFALSLIGAVVGEFVAASAGLGFLIKAKTAELDVAAAFAGTVTLGIIGAIGVQALKALQERAIFWQSRDETASTAGTKHG